MMLHKRLFISGLVLSLSCIVEPAFCQLPAPTPQSSLTPTPDQEKQDAFAAIQRLRAAKTLPEISDALTIKSAAQVGLIAALGMSVTIAFAGSPNGKPVDPDFNKDLSAYMNGFGVPLETTLDGLNLNKLPPSVASRGHEFLSGLAPFDSRVKKIAANVGGPPVASLPGTVTGYRMTVVDANTVKLVQVQPNSNWPTTLYGRYEDGSWRVDAGDLAAMISGPPAPNYPPTPGADAEKLFDAVRDEEPATVSAILAHKPSLIEARDDQGDTPLIAECFWGSLDVVKVLVAHHANVNASDNAGTTALIQAAMFDKADVASYLISHGAKVNTTDLADHDPLYYAKQQNNSGAVKILEAHGAK